MVPEDTRCVTCGFELWNPLAQFSVSQLGFYSDSRFPGRCILKLDGHYEHLDELPREVLAGFMEDAQLASRVLRTSLTAARVNFSVLGNSEGHVHAHLIPRYPEREEFPQKSPWDDPRPRTACSPRVEEELLNFLRPLF